MQRFNIEEGLFVVLFSKGYSLFQITANFIHLLRLIAPEAADNRALPLSSAKVVLFMTPLAAFV